MYHLFKSSCILLQLTPQFIYYIERTILYNLVKALVLLLQLHPGML
jgi:hypothetical protein